MSRSWIACAVAAFVLVTWQQCGEGAVFTTKLQAQTFPTWNDARDFRLATLSRNNVTYEVANQFEVWRAESFPP